MNYEVLYNNLLIDYNNLRDKFNDISSQIEEKYKEQYILDICELYKNIKAGINLNDEGSAVVFKILKKIIEEKDITIIDRQYLQNLNGVFNPEIAEAVGIMHTNFKARHNYISKILSDGFIDNKTNKIIVYPKVIVYNYSE